MIKTYFIGDMNKEQKIRINAQTKSIRLADCSLSLIKEIDLQRTKLNLSRVAYIKHIAKRPLSSQEEITAFRKELREKGYSTIEHWLLEYHGMLK